MQGAPTPSDDESSDVAACPLGAGVCVCMRKMAPGLGWRFKCIVGSERLESPLVKGTALLRDGNICLAPRSYLKCVKITLPQK